VIDIDTSSKAEQRKFGIVIGMIILALGLFRWWHHDFEHIPYILFPLGGTLFLLGIVAPRVLQPVFVLWMKFAIAVNWLMTRVVLALAFYLIITPVRVLVSVFSEDPLKRKWLPEAETYWEEPEEQPAEFERYKNQF